MLDVPRRDLRAALERDPAARSAWQVAFTYAGVHAVWAHRVNHWLWQRGHHLIARMGSQAARLLTGVEIHPGAQLGPGLFIDHAMGVVIGETAEVGTDVTMFHGVTLGGTRLHPGKRHPTIGDRVTIGAGAKVLGPIEVGSDSRIGANAVVVKPVPPNSVVVGVPGQVVLRSKPRANRVDLDDTDLPDLIGVSLQGLVQRLDHLETVVEGEARQGQPVPSPAGTWAGEDFSI